MDKEELIFQMEKERPILNTRGLRGYIVKHYDVPFNIGSRIAIRITNYQIQKYGEIVNRKVGYLRNKKLASQIARQRKYQRTKPR